MSFSKYKEIGLNILVLILSILFSLIIVEIYLRVSGRFTGRRSKQLGICPGSANYSIKQFHPIYGWQGVPNTQFLEKRSSLDNWSLHTFNSDGFPITYQRDDPGDRSIVVLGDSLTRGSLVGNEHKYPYLLDKWLPDWDVKNFGVEGFGTHQELLLYRHKVRSIEHDLVILQYSFFDPFNNASNEPGRPKYEIRDGRLELVRYPTRSNGGETGGFSLVGFLHGFFITHTELYPFLLDAPQLMVQSLPKHYLPVSKTGQKKLNLTRILLESLVDEVTTSDRKMVLITRFYGLYKDQIQMLRDLSNEHSGLYLLDLTEKNIENKDKLKGERPNLPDVDTHWNEIGHWHVAKYVYEWLYEKDYIEEKRSGLENDLVRYPGDDQCPGTSEYSTP